MQNNLQNRLCKCGCKQLIIIKPHHKFHPVSYLPFHHKRPKQFRNKVCPICHITFTFRWHGEAHYKNKKFCSNKCYKIWWKDHVLIHINRIKQDKTVRIQVTCQICDKKFITTASRLKYGRGKLCSPLCRARYVGKLLKKDVSVSKYRQLAIEAYGAKCTRCGYNKIPDILEVHHLDTKHSNNQLDNLLVVCPTCHEIYHFEARTGRYRFKSAKTNDLSLPNSET